MVATTFQYKLGVIKYLDLENVVISMGSGGEGVLAPLVYPFCCLFSVEILEKRPFCCQSLVYKV